jgi:hypothetical protein
MLAIKCTASVAATAFNTYFVPSAAHNNPLPLKPESDLSIYYTQCFAEISIKIGYGMMR